MSIFLFTSFILSFFVLRIFLPPRQKNREIFLYTILCFSSVIVLTTEILSLFGKLNFLLLSLFWSGYSVVGILIVVVNRTEVINHIQLSFARVTSLKTNLTGFHGFVLVVLVIFLIAIFLQGIIYPPNNWDSMTYHMSRVSHWVVNCSVNHYPTHIYRQLFQPPFAEFFITHTVILQKSDLFANCVQFLFLISTLVAVSLIAEQLGLPKQMQASAALLALLTPEIILQGSSTKNDIVVSFFVLSCIYYVIKSIKTRELLAVAAVGISTGLAILTKGTSYIYIIPPMLFLTIYYSFFIFRTKKFSFLTHGLVIVLIATLINTGHYYRNYSLTGSMLGITESLQNKYTNEDITFSGLSSNTIRNLALHFSPGPLAQYSLEIAWRLHLFLDLDINDRKYTYENLNFHLGNTPTQEDYAPNLPNISFFLVALGFQLVYFLRNGMKANNMILILSIIIISQFIFFCLFLKWQPWHTRLHTPLFFLMAPIIIFNFSTFHKRIIFGVLFLCLLYGTAILLFNASRPFITKPPLTTDITITDSREKKYFANQPSLYEEYSRMKAYLSIMNFKHVGLIIGSDTWEYPLINTFDQTRAITFEHINLSEDNLSKNIISPNENISVIICDRRKSFVTYKREIFRRKSNGNHLFLYEK